MKEYKKLQQKINNLTKNEIYALIERLGYKSNINKAIEKIESLKNNSLESYLSQAMFDYKYSTKEFLYKIAELLEVDKNRLKNEVNELENYLTKISKLPQPYIFVYTNFKRTSQPLFVLAIMEGKRRIMIDKTVVFNKTIEENLNYISNIVKHHYKENNGKLDMWGKIQKYIYHHIDNKTYVFDKDGNLIDNNEICESKASLQIKNKEIKI